MRQSPSQVLPESGERGPTPAGTGPENPPRRGPVVERIAGWSARHKKTAVFGWLALVAFPGTILGAWVGAKLYHAMSDRNFTDLVLVLLFLSGVGLVWNSISTS